MTKTPSNERSSLTLHSLSKDHTGGRAVVGAPGYQTVSHEFEPH